MAKATLWPATDAEARKRGEQRGLDTPVVHALTMFTWCRPLILVGAEANALSEPLRSTAARLKLKRIDGSLHKRWSTWFNSTINEKPHPGLTY